jgi:tetratricopeptide (TPR) repeat protein/transcriptional regulator with XRE-family HTH domain
MNENQIHPLQQARKKLGIRQKVLADLTGLSEPTIKRAESGKPLDDYTISAICEYFAMRYGRQVKPEELGLRAKWEREEILLNDASVPEENDSEEDIERDPPKGSRQISVNLLKSEDTFFIPPQHELLLKTGTKDWTVWASMKLMQIFTLIGSIGGQDHASEEVCEEIQTLLDQEIKMLDDMIPQDSTKNEYLISRRQALMMIAALPSSMSNWTSIKTNGPVSEEFLPQCAASITACWHLMREKGLEAVEEILPTYMPLLVTLTLHPSQYQTAAARLATQANILRAIVAKHRLKDTEREKYAHEAVRCSHFACDKKLQAAALMTQGYTYVFCFPLRPQAAIETFQAALRILEEEDSLLRSDIHIGLADAYAQCGKEKEALETIALAQDHFPSYPEHDPSFLYADCSLPVLYQWEGKMYLHLAEHSSSKEQYQKAWNAFGQAMKTQPLHQRGISEVTIDQANVARGIGELPAYTDHLRRGVEMALALKSQRRYQEAIAIYLQTPDRWLTEREIRTLAKEVFGGQLPKRG